MWGCPGLAVIWTGRRNGISKWLHTPLKSTLVKMRSCRWEQVTVKPWDWRYITVIIIHWLYFTHEIPKTYQFRLFSSQTRIHTRTLVFWTLYTCAFVFMLLCICMKQRDLCNSVTALSLWIRCLCVSSGSEEHYSQGIWLRGKGPCLLQERNMAYFSDSAEQSYMFSVHFKSTCFVCGYWAQQMVVSWFLVQL